MTEALVLLPLLCGVLLLFVRSPDWSRRILMANAVAHFGLTIYCSYLRPGQAINGDWFALDVIGKYFLTVTSVLFLASAFYANGYLIRQKHLKEHPTSHPSYFLASLLFFLASMSFVALCQQLEMLWVAIEATTLASAPLIYFHKSPHSLEATWKYLMITSFGIAIGLLGNFFLFHSITGTASGQGSAASFVLSKIVANPPPFDPLWLKTAFIFLFVGYGTKMGLVPLHTWLPDAHSEAPSLVSALLSGSALNCAFLGILRAHQVCLAAGAEFAEFSRHLLLVFGLISMGVAIAFILRQRDLKRLLAYSSVEHMGLLAFSVGLGGEAVFGGTLHLLHHSLIKAMLFLLAGNFLIAYQTKSTERIAGALRVLPVSGPLFFLGFLALSGFPPFGLFMSEFMILKSAFDQGHVWIASLFLLFLVGVLMCMAPIVLNMLLGSPLKDQGPGLHHPTLKRPEWFWTIGSPILLATLLLLLGSWIPPFLSGQIRAIASLLGGLS